MPESPPLAIPLRAEFAPAEMPSSPSSDDPRDRGRHGHRPLSGAQISDPNYSGKSPQLRVDRISNLARRGRVAPNGRPYIAPLPASRVGKRHDIFRSTHTLSRIV